MIYMQLVICYLILGVAFGIKLYCQIEQSLPYLDDDLKELFENNIIKYISIGVVSIFWLFVSVYNLYRWRVDN